MSAGHGFDRRSAIAPDPLSGRSPRNGAGPAALRAGPPAREAQRLAVRIDHLVARRWADAKAEPAPRADDAEFLRRVFLDVAGRIPTVEEARSFLDDRDADKRTKLVEKLLTGPRYVTHVTNLWRALLLPEAGNNFQVRLQQGSFENWLKKQAARNVGYDKL